MTETITATEEIRSEKCSAAGWADVLEVGRGLRSEYGGHAGRRPLETMIVQ